MMNDDGAVRIEIKDGARQDIASADAALRHHAKHAENEIAFADPPDRAKRGMGQPRSVTFAQANCIVGNITGRFLGCGLSKGDIIFLQMPNVIEAPLLILGAWRAGLTAALAPLLWRLDEINRAFSQIKPKGAVTISQFGDERPAQTLGEAAAKSPSVRFVYAFGENIPDGVTPIDDWLNETGAHDHGEGAPQEPAQPDTQAIITWTVLPQGPCPVPRSHGEIAATAKMFSSHMKLERGSRVLNTYSYSSISAVAGQLVAPLLAGAQIMLHLPFDFGVFNEQLQQNGITCTTVPAPVIAALEERGNFNTPGQSLARIGCVWPNPHGVISGPRAIDTPVPIFDIHNFAELAVLVRERDAACDPSLLPLGKTFLPGEQEDGAPVVETRVRGAVTHEDNQQVLRGTLCVCGTSVPAGPFLRAETKSGTALQPDSHGYLDTGIGCVVGETIAGHFRCGKSEDLIYHGGAVIAASELDRLYAEFPEFLDAAAFVLDDSVIGERIFAAVVPKPEISPSLERLKAFLHAKRVAPYKTPDQLIIVRSIPRSGKGAVQRDRILEHV